MVEMLDKLQESIFLVEQKDNHISNTDDKTLEDR
jgi:hypothetical protein